MAAPGLTDDRPQLDVVQAERLRCPVEMGLRDAVAAGLDLLVSIGRRAVDREARPVSVSASTGDFDGDEDRPIGRRQHRERGTQ